MLIKQGQFYEDDNRIYKIVDPYRIEANGTSPRRVVDVQPQVNGQIWETRGVRYSLFERMFSNGELRRIDVNKYLKMVQKQFLSNGFHTSPLYRSQIIKCYNEGLTLDETYGVGCDVYAGYEFEESLQAAKNEENTA